MIWTMVIFWWVWYFISAWSSYAPISKQIDVKTLQIYTPSYIVKKWSSCDWTCINYSSSSSYWAGSYWWK